MKISPKETFLILQSFRSDTNYAYSDILIRDLLMGADFFTFIALFAKNLCKSLKSCRSTIRNPAERQKLAAQQTADLRKGENLPLSNPQTCGKVKTCRSAIRDPAEARKLTAQHSGNSGKAKKLHSAFPGFGKVEKASLTTKLPTHSGRRISYDLQLPDE